jgi:hypothetical protein
LWARFSYSKTQTSGGDIKIVLENTVSTSVPEAATHRDALEAIARKCDPPLPIVSLDDELAAHWYPMGKTIFGNAGDRIDDIVSNHDGLHWWVSASGLNVARGLINAPTISPFDQLAGKMYCDGSEDQKLSKELLMQIADAVDKAGFRILKELQPAQRKPIAKHNQKFAKSAIKTFAQAVRSRFAKYVLRRLYVARDRYRNSAARS